MKNKTLAFLFLIGLTVLIYFLTNDFGYCAAHAAQTAKSASQTVTNNVLNNTIIKFLYAMGGVALSSLLIFGGLTVYNKIFVKNPHYQSEEENILKTPKTVEDAIIFFLKKNKM